MLKRKTRRRYFRFDFIKEIRAYSEHSTRSTSAKKKPKDYRTSIPT